MARIIKGKKPKFVDELEQAERNIERLREQFDVNLSLPNTDITAFIDDVIPYVPNVGTTKTLVDQTIATGEIVEQYRTLYGHSDSMFKTRADYERTRRYVNRINRAAESEWSSEETYALGGINSQLTAVREAGGTIQSEFMRRESSLATRNANKKVIESLKEQGINMVKVPVMKRDSDTGEFTYVYDESRHKVYQYLPETPEQERRYFYTVQRNPSMQVSQPYVPDDGYIFKWGDAVQVEQRKQKKKSPKAIVDSLLEDEYEADRAQLYLENYRNMIDDVLPSSVADMFDEVFDAILELSPSEQVDIVDNIINGDDIADLEYFYREAGTAVAPKLYEIAQGIKESIEDVIDTDDFEVFGMEVDDFLEGLEESPLSQGQNIYATYQQRKSEGSVTTSTLNSVRRGR